MRSGIIHRTGGHQTHALRAKAAFTLVELLVVIGIIALLISILLPALNRARSQANTVKCQANLRSIGQALYLYTGQTKGMLPIGFWNGTGPGVPAGTSGTNWVLLTQSALSGKFGTDWNTGGASSTSKVREMFMCPDAPGDTAKSNQVSGATSYASHPRLMPMMDLNLGYPVDGYFTPRRPFTPYKIASIKRSAEIIIVFDGSLVESGNTGVWGPGGQVPVANYLDGHGFTQPGPGGSYMTDVYPAGAQPWNHSGAAIYFDSGPATNTDSAANPNNIRFRHQKNNVVNTLMVDGHVTSFQFKNSSNGALKRGNVNVNPPR